MNKSKIVISWMKTYYYFLVLDNYKKAMETIPIHIIYLTVFVFLSKFLNKDFKKTRYVFHGYFVLLPVFKK